MARAIPTRIVWPDDMPDPKERAFARSIIESTEARRLGALRLPDPQRPGDEMRAVVKHRVYCNDCDASWCVHEVLSLQATRSSATPVPLLRVDGECPFCRIDDVVPELAPATIRAIVAAVAKTGSVHELAVAADLALNRGDTTTGQLRHPDDVAMLEALARLLEFVRAELRRHDSDGKHHTCTKLLAALDALGVPAPMGNIWLEQTMPSWLADELAAASRNRLGGRETAPPTIRAT